MRLSPEGLAFLSHEEGLETSPYRDEADKLSIGVGHCFTAAELESGTLTIDGAVVPWRPGITLAQVQALLAQDCAPREDHLSRLLVPPLSDNQFAAAFSLFFNAQPPDTASVWAIINGGDWTDLKAHWLQWHWITVNGVKQESPKLLARRGREYDLWGTPDA